MISFSDKAVAKVKEYADQMPEAAGKDLPIVPGENAVQIAKRAKQQATLGGYDVFTIN